MSLVLEAVVPLQFVQNNRGIFRQERIVIQCLVNRIALYSPHTALDAVRGGVNDWLLEPFGKIIYVIG